LPIPSRDNRDPVLLFFIAHREIPHRLQRGNAVYWIGLQWTKLGRRATLQCNVDRFGADG